MQTILSSEMLDWDINILNYPLGYFYIALSRQDRGSITTGGLSRTARDDATASQMNSNSNHTGTSSPGNIKPFKILSAFLIRIN